MYEEEIVKDRNGKPIRVKQRSKKYVESVAKHDIVFGVGPAGTGKTFLAVVLAIAALKGEVQNHFDAARCGGRGKPRLSTRGSERKVDPYLRPVYDALYQILDWIIRTD